MGLTIHRPQPEVPAGGLMADRRLYLDQTQARMLEETDAEAAFLLAAKGQAIPRDAVARLQLCVAEGRVVQGNAVSVAGIVQPVRRARRSRRAAQ